MEIRKMKKEEKREVKKIAVKAFSFFEGLFIGTPKEAIVAVIDNKIVGGITYKNIDNSIYIDFAFVDPKHQGKNIGKELYRETFKQLNAPIMTALVKDDNVASFKIFEDNGFKKVSIPEFTQKLGIKQLIKHLVQTPFLIGTGLELYVKNNNIKTKENSKNELITFLIMNILLVAPLWLLNNLNIFYALLAHLTVLIIFLLTRFTLKIIDKEAKFRFNNGGAITVLGLSLVGNIFLMNGNWYPRKYEKTKSFQKKLAIPEIIKWIIFLILPLCCVFNHVYFRLVSQISLFYLIYMTVPFYPFESLGAGRIYNYNKLLWLAFAILTIVDATFIFKVLL